MENLLKDLQHGVRILLKNPGFSLLTILALALGIGSTTAIFSVVNAVLLRPLPFRDSERLMIVGEINIKQKGAENEIGIAPANYLDYRNQNNSFESIGAFSMTTRTGFNLGEVGEPERLTAANVTANLFPTLGVNPIYGRYFLPEEEKRGNHRSVMLSHGLWKRRFGSDPQIIGKTILLSSSSYLVVGIMPEGFQFPTKDVLPALRALEKPVEVWVPLSIPDADWTARGSRFMHAVGRLKPSVTIEQARANLNTVAGQLAQKYEQDIGWGAQVIPLLEQMVGSVRRALLVLFGAVSFVLLIACANVANLLLARAATRQKEITLRVVLGAGRGRLVRQLLTESVLFALISGVLGMALGVWGVNLLVSLSPQSIPLSSQVGIDGNVLIFSLVVSFLTAIFFGLAPALQASKVDLNEVIKETGGRSMTGVAGRRVRNALVVAEIALAVVLLVGAGLMVKSFVRLENVKPGFEPKGTLTFQHTLPGSKYPDDPEVIAFYRQLNEKLASLPGVESASGMTALPFSKASNYTSFLIDGRPPLPQGEFLLAEHIGIFPGYFKTARVPIMRGREFTEQDTKASVQGVIINEAMARQFWPNEDPLGKHIKIDYDQGLAREVIGVVGNVKNFGLDADPKPEMYVSQYQFPFYSTFLMVRGAGNPAGLRSAIVQAVVSIDKDQPIYNVKTMEEVMYASNDRRRFNMLLMSCFAVVAAILASVGLYGLMAYSVTQRRSEIGVRMALGAEPRNILKLIVGDGLKLAGTGVAIGLLGAFALTRVIESLLFGISTTDPVTFLGISLLLVVVALLSSFIPARRAMKIEPMEALRYE